jgi:hypothetical protein
LSPYFLPVHEGCNFSRIGRPYISPPLGVVFPNLFMACKREQNTCFLAQEKPLRRSLGGARRDSTGAQRHKDEVTERLHSCDQQSWQSTLLASVPPSTLRVLCGIVHSSFSPNFPLVIKKAARGGQRRRERCYWDKRSS